MSASNMLRVCFQTAARRTMSTGTYARPKRTRDLALHEAGKGIVQMGVIFGGLWAVMWFGVIAPQKKKFKEFYKNDNPEKAFFQMRQAGVFQSCRPLTDDSPEFFIGKYCGDKETESVEDAEALFKKYPDLKIRVVKREKNE